MAKTNLEVELVGQDGNVFNLAGLVSKALKRGGYSELAKEFLDKLPSCGSYDEALRLMSKYVEVS